MDNPDRQAMPCDHTPPQRSGTLRAAGRLLLGLIGATLIVFGGLFVSSGLRVRESCKEAETAQVLNLNIDVGAAGQHRAALKQSVDFTCRQYIRMEPAFNSGERAESALDGLQLTVTVQDSNGTEWMAGAFPAPMAVNADGSITLVESRPMPVGDYSVLIDVVSPAPALAGRPVRIVSGYLLCGLEWMGPMIGIGGGSVAVAIGAIIGGVLWMTCRR